MGSSEWELSKENVRPIKQGRKIPNLTAALTPCGVLSVEDDSLYTGSFRRTNSECYMM